MSQDEHAYVIQLGPNEFVSNARKGKLSYNINSCADPSGAKKFKNKANAGAFIAKYELYMLFEYFVTTLVSRRPNQPWLLV
jgi:hypothetical protein